MRSYLKIYGIVLGLALFCIGLFNFLVDPLWYFGGNHLTGINLPWNERVTKTNLFLQNPNQYDCLILGTSRTTLLNPAKLKQHHCFNYAISGGNIEEFVNYGAYAKSKGLEPQVVYLEVEFSNFHLPSQPKVYEAVTDPLPAYKTYLLSSNVLGLSYKTLTGDHSFARQYDRNFHGMLSDDAPDYEPQFEQTSDPETCDPDRIKFYQQLRQLFPQAQFVGFVAPVSAWYVFNGSYLSDSLSCELAGIYQVAQLFDGFYDFAVPSALTTQTDNTYDGNHYYPAVFDRIAKVLEGRKARIGVDVKQLTLANYQALYQTGLKDFLVQNHQENLWRG